MPLRIKQNSSGRKHPTNPLMNITDIAAVAAIAKPKKILTRR
jgi:hypothetical protein